VAREMMRAFKDVSEGKYPHREAYEDILEKYNWDKIAKSWRDKLKRLL